LIARNYDLALEMLTIDLDAQETMPIFSFREEAEMFIRLSDYDGWSVRENSAEELVSLLLGPYSYVKKVALDPLPEICDEGMSRLVSVSRKDFTRTLLGGRETGVTLAHASTTQRLLPVKEASLWAWR